MENRTTIKVPKKYHERIDLLGKRDDGVFYARAKYPYEFANGLVEDIDWTQKGILEKIRGTRKVEY